jgi:hypothetical protein
LILNSKGIKLPALYDSKTPTLLNRKSGQLV